MLKKQISIVLTICLLIVALAACSNEGQGTTTGRGNETTGTATGSDDETDAPSAEPTNLVFWYNHKGDEATVYENVIQMFNESQSDYVVEGLSVTDKQKVIVAIASSESPDAIEASNQDVIAYQANGLLESLGDYIDSDGYDTSIYSAQSLEANTIGDELYALPTSSIVIQMYYNIDLLEEAGYDAPPETMEELYEIAQAVTTTDDAGNIDIIGYPLFPLASARQELIYAFGGRWWDENNQLTPQAEGVIDSLEMNIAFREQYGIEKTQAFITTANTNRYTEQDMFFAGKQLFRFDGVWLSTMIESYNSDLNYGVTLIPGTEANPELRGSSRFETTSLAIPVVAAEKDAAWELIKYITNSEGTETLNMGMGNLPALVSLWEDPDILTVPDFPNFIEALKSENGIQYPAIADLSKYTALIEEHLDYIYNGMMTPEEGINALSEQAANLE